jgi:hypothetical protein
MVYEFYLDTPANLGNITLGEKSKKKKEEKKINNFICTIL